jgi:Ca-activated chloride channel family protein
MVPGLYPLIILSLVAALTPSAWAQVAPLPAAEHRLQVAVNVVNVHVTARNRAGALLDDLQRRDFDVFEDGKKQDLRYFSRYDNVSVSLVLLIDASTSQTRVLAREQAIAAHFLEQALRPGDRAAVVSFDSNAYVVQDFTSDLVRLRLAIARITPFAPGFQPVLPPAEMASGTRLCAAVNWVAALPAQNWLDRRVVIVISDGVDPEIRACVKPTVAAALRNDLMIYSIRTLDGGVYGHPGVAEQGERALSRLAHDTGGLLLRGTDPGKLSAAFAHIAAELRGQYSLGYTPQKLVRDGRLRRIKVVVNRKAAQVRARRGYVPSTL